MKITEKLVENLDLDLAVLGDSYNDINFSDIISRFEQDKFRDYWYIEAKGKTESYDDFYTDADDCNIIFKNKEKKWEEIIDKVKKFSFLSTGRKTKPIGLVPLAI